KPRPAPDKALAAAGAFHFLMPIRVQCSLMGEIWNTPMSEILRIPSHETGWPELARLKRWGVIAIYASQDELKSPNGHSRQPYSAKVSRSSALGLLGVFDGCYPK